MEETVSFCLILPKELKSKLQEEATKKSISTNALIRMILLQHYDYMGK